MILTEPPYSEELEQAVVDAMFTISDTAVHAFNNLSENDFHIDWRKKLMIWMKDNYKQGSYMSANEIAIDVPSIKPYLAQCDPKNFLALDRFKLYCDRLKELRMMRELRLTLMESLQACSSPTQSVWSVQGLVMRGLKDNASIDGKLFSTPTQILKELEGRSDEDRLFTGVSLLDNIMFQKGGQRRKQLEQVMAITGHGKSQYMMWRASLMIRKGMRGIWLQFEDSDISTVDELKKQIPEDHEYFDNLVITDECRTIQDIKKQCRIAKYELGIHFAVIDYIQNVGANEIKSGEETKKTQFVSGELRDMVKDLNIFGLSASQVARDKSRKGWAAEPKLQDMKQSSQLEQDAFAITSVFRPAMIDELLYDENRVKWHNDAVMDSNLISIRQAKIRKQKRITGSVKMIQTNTNGLQLYNENGVNI